MTLRPEITNNDPNLFRRAGGIFGLLPFVALSALQVVLFFAGYPGHDWRYLTGLPVTAVGLFIVIRNWGNPKLVLLGAVIAFIGNAFPFFITD
ncbi:MAG: hypothetical protein WKF57_01675 [Nakamurella sp.]